MDQDAFSQVQQQIRAGITKKVKQLFTDETITSVRFLNYDDYDDEGYYGFDGDTYSDWVIVNNKDAYEEAYTPEESAVAYKAEKLFQEDQFYAAFGHWVEVSFARNRDDASQIELTYYG